MRLASLCLVVLVAGTPLAAQSAPAPSRREVPAAISRIREADLRRDVFAMASDAMRGREAGTADELRASLWIADALKGIGVAPAGDDGGYLQWFPITRTRISTASSQLTIDGRALTLYADVIPWGTDLSDVSGAVTWVASALDTANIKGKVVAVPLLTPEARLIRAAGGAPFVRYAQAAIAYTLGALTPRQPAAVILVADAQTDSAFAALAVLQSRGQYNVDRAAARFAGQPYRIPPVSRSGLTPAVLVREGARTELQRSPTVTWQMRVERFETPSVNIVGVIRGTDPVLREEYVVFSSHQDHDGVRYTYRGDSTFAGADDNASVSAALLASARAFVQQRPKRSILFVYHGAEEKGLLGSRYHAAHPVVPLERMVTVLNGDMIGRNHPDSAMLLGVQPPHRNSADLVAHALRANALTGAFRIDSLWDRPTHPEGWYFRSDHVPYARLNVPALMYSTGLHADYHTPQDKPERIDYAKLTRMTQWMYLTGWFVANAPTRPAIDANFALER